MDKKTGKFFYEFPNTTDLTDPSENSFKSIRNQMKSKFDDSPHMSVKYRKMLLKQKKLKALEEEYENGI